ncbi:PFL_4695 family integrating conjugative element protein [Comamonas testosteroni]|uniref:Integrating conjugative element protein n=1 Tax=Comamonas testosteroni TaxID=285 RepID=A0A096FA95_COMTE|nr:integrating conjugative element protein [Comamonas testosteroni]KGH27296.1 hypothetical protein P353_18620 [Comamonas testosteroni]
MRCRFAILALGLACSAPALAGVELEMIHDSGKSVPLAPYVAQIVGGTDEANVLDGLRFPFRSQLRGGVLKQDGVQVFNGQWLTQPMFVLGADDASLRWVAFNHKKLIQLNAVGIVVQAATPAAFKLLQQVANPLQLAPDTGAFLAETLIAKGAPVFPVLVHSNGRAYQILPQSTFGVAP